MTLAMVGYSCALTYVHMQFFLEKIPGLRYLYDKFFLVKIQIDMFASYGLAVFLGGASPE
jgi:hypothetical protein